MCASELTTPVISEDTSPGSKLTISSLCQPQYESPARRVAPILVDASSCTEGAKTERTDLEELENFEVFGNVPPSSWLFLSALMRQVCSATPKS